MNHFPIFGLESLAKTLAFALALQLAGAPALAQTLPTAINIVVVQGEGATGPVRQQPKTLPAVRIVDEKQAPVSGAAVVFTLPTEGATGEFSNGSKTLMMVTDAQGIASAKGLRFNQIPGKVPINVSASYKGLTARADIMQVSEAPAGYKPSSSGGHTGRIVAILAVLAAGGAGAAIYATHKNGSTPTTPTVPTVQPIGITPGTGTLAPPH